MSVIESAMRFTRSVRERHAEIRGIQKAIEIIESKFKSAQIEYSIPMRYDILDALRDEIKRLEDFV